VEEKGRRLRQGRRNRWKKRGVGCVRGGGKGGRKGAYRHGRREMGGRKGA
jgi:hypothetical protein